jgi:lipopolysaccharide/colanic/teichoic acid biosynthesis glycosyltransferase
MLRGNFDTVQEALIVLTPYTLITIGSASVVFLICGLDRTPWRYVSVAEHLQIIVLTVLVILLTLGFTFAVNRLEGVARTLPVMQGGLIISILISARAVARLSFNKQVHENGNGHLSNSSQETVLIVGANTITELFLLSVQELASHQIQVAGILTEKPMMLGRAIGGTPVLGTVDDLQNILQTLEVHGVAVDRIVVATAADRLLPRARDILSEVEKSSNIVVHFISERLGFDSSLTPSASSGRERNIVGEQRQPALVRDLDHVNFIRKSFRLKRIVDGFGAIFLILILAPIIIVAALIVVLDVGFPLIFWQQRPGLHGRPFKMYKFRTMGAPHDNHWKRIPDDQRSSAIGQILRRTRLDELPQLYNVLIGDMSLVGPRPLLPHDQSVDYAARLFMRPGITGWAQVNGGRIISPTDKCTLDVWYAQNACIMLDIKIILLTAKMVIFGDRLNIKAVDQARGNLVQ